MTLVMAILSALPAEAAQPLDRLLACRQIAGSTPRLACFDRESAAVAAARAPRAGTIAGPRPPATAGASASASTRVPEPAVPSAGLGEAAASRGAALDPQQTFGLPPEQILAREEAARKSPRPLEHIEAHIVALGSTGDGREIFTLDNHQVWAELEPDGDLYAKPGETVEISRGWLGSYALSLKSRRSSKVTRLR